MKKKIILLFSLTSIIFLFSNCEYQYNGYEGNGPCDSAVPQPIGNNEVIITQNNDTVEYRNFDTIKLGRSYVRAIWDSKYLITMLQMNYNNNDDYKNNDSIKLFNGAKSYEIYIGFKGTLNSLSTDAGAYIYYTYSNNQNNVYYNLVGKSQLTITKYEKVWGAVEGSFNGNFVNEHDNTDTLKMKCKFNAIRWCDDYQ